MNIIEHIIEPKRLILAWQPPEGRGTRKRHLVAELYKTESGIEFKYLENTEDLNEAKNLGFVGYPAFKLSSSTFTSGVIEAFMRRLPPRQRVDYPQYLTQFRLSRDVPISDFALLGYTGAALPRDGFSIINPFDNVTSQCELMVEVAGFRYRENINIDEIHTGDSVSFCPDPSNVKDPWAVQIFVNKDLFVGYVCRGLTSAFQRWMNSAELRGVVERINGSPNRPLIYVFTTVKPRYQGYHMDLRHQ